MQRRGTVRLLLYNEERVSLYSIGRRHESTSSLYKRETLSLLCIKKESLSSLYIGETLSPLYRGGVCLLSIEKEAHSFSMKRRECHSSV